MKTIDDIIFKIYANPILQNVSKSDIVTAVKDVVDFLGIPATLQEKSNVISVLNYRAKLPSDLYNLKAVIALKAYGVRDLRIKSSTDDRIQQQHVRRDPQPSSITYKAIHGYLHTDFESGDVEIIYTAYTVDANGFPMIPNEVSLQKAIENYVKVSYFTILHEMGQISERVLERAEQQYNWYMGQASNAFNTPSPEETESLFNAITRLIPHRDGISTNYKYDSIPEKLRPHD